MTTARPGRTGRKALGFAGDLLAGGTANGGCHTAIHRQPPDIRADDGIDVLFDQVANDDTDRSPVGKLIDIGRPGQPRMLQVSAAPRGIARGFRAKSTSSVAIQGETSMDELSSCLRIAPND